MVKLKLVREATHRCPTGIEVRGGEEIGKRVVVSAYDKRLVNEIFFKVVRDMAHLRVRNLVLPK